MVKKHSDGLTDAQYAEYQAIAVKYDGRAKPRKDTTLNMRISSSELSLIKQAAQAQGYKKYQAWVHDVLLKAIQPGM